MPTSPLIQGTAARRFSTAPIADSQRLTPAVQTNVRTDGQRRVTPFCAEGNHLKKPAKTREQLESAIRTEMEDICEWPTGLALSVVPHEDSWKVVIMTEGPQDAERCDMIETIADRLRSQFDLKN